MRRLHQGQPRGQSSAEYALLLVLVVIVVILVLVFLGGGLGRSYQAIVNSFGTPGTSVAAATTSEPASTSAVSPSPATTSPTTGTANASTSQAGATAVPNGSGNASTSQAATASAATPNSSATAAPGSCVGTTDLCYDAFDGSGNMTWTSYYGTWATSSQAFTTNDVYARVIGAIPFSNYEFTADVQTLQSKDSVIWDVTRVIFRAQDADNFYAVMIKTDGVVELAANRNGQWQSWISVTATKFSPYDNHSFRIKAFSEHIQVFIDGKKEVDYRDPNPILTGGVGFTNVNSMGRVDNVEVNRRAQDA